MWASVLLIAFLVGATKIYFDHRATNMEILIFCAFASTFALAACTVTICRFPKNPSVNNIRNISQPQLRNPPTTSTTTTINDFNFNTNHFQQLQPQQQQLPNPQQQSQQLSANVVGTNAAPPPYHIAILLPEENKDLQQPDESPPPSYDKILI